jgi:hypothetical protein
LRTFARFIVDVIFWIKNEGAACGFDDGVRVRVRD